MNTAEFEDLIEQVIEEKITRREISSTYHISIRTINNEITKLSKSNPELYKRFIAKYPFQSKKITHIDFTELTKSIIKNDAEIQQIIDVYDISARTFNRRLNNMKNSQKIDVLTGLTEDQIYQLYIRYRKNQLTFEDKEFIETMEIGDIIVEEDRNTNRKVYLQNVLDNYYKLISEGMSKAEAARRLGYTYTDMDKKEKELKRIETEDVTKDELRSRIKVNVNHKPNLQNSESKEIKQYEEEGEIR